MSKLEKHPQKLRHHARWLQVLAGHIARSGIPEILAATTLVLSRYNSNIDFSYPSEIVIPIILFGILTAGLYYLYHFVTKRVAAAHIAALCAGYMFYSYTQAARYIVDFCKGVLPNSLETPFSTSVAVTTIVLLMGGVLGLLCARILRMHLLRGLQVGKIIVFAVVFIFCVQAAKTTSKWVDIYPQLTYKPTVTMPEKTRVGTSKPDIYYVVLDRYANNETLTNEFAYDNAAFTDALKQQGFLVRSDAYANYPFTMSSISSTLAMGYHTDLGKQFGDVGYHTAFPYRALLRDPPVAQVLKHEGYQYNQVSSWWDFTRVGIRADSQPTRSFRLTILGKSFYLSDLTRDIMNKSILSPWLKKGLHIGQWRILTYDNDDNPRQNLEKQLSALTTIASTPHDNPQFTFAHVLSPHDPYIFAADGSDPPYDEGRNDSGADEKVKYTNQLTYLNARIGATIADIRKSSPGAIVVVQADEGPYPKDFRYAELSPSHYYDPTTLPDNLLAQKFGVLSAIYAPGKEASQLDAEVQSSVNVFRMVLDTYLGYTLPLLPDCHFSTGNKFVLYRYQNAANRLPGADDSRCSDYLSGQ